MEKRKQLKAQGLNKPGAEMDESVDEKNRKKVENLCGMFSHVDCALVHETFYGCNRNMA